MRILHLEASAGWGGQEIRILRESEGMRGRGHEIILVVQTGGGLVAHAKEKGFTVYEASFARKDTWKLFFRLVWIILKHKIDIVNTHSSRDAWIGGVVARLLCRRIIRTRHLSTQIRPGLNSRILYNWLADSVVTTCEAVVTRICEQSRLPFTRCRSIPTGLDPYAVQADAEEVKALKRRYGIAVDDIVIGTACMLRSWKGISDLLHAAKQLEGHDKLKWMVVGGGVSEHHFRNLWKEMGLTGTVIFTGHLNNPYPAMAAMDVFVLLSTANEGVSQASLQAAWLEKPLVTTTIGGLPEVCVHGKTGFHVPPNRPTEVAEKVLILARDTGMRTTMGQAAKQLVQDRFTLNKMLDEMESVYRAVLR